MILKGLPAGKPAKPSVMLALGQSFNCPLCFCGHNLEGQQAGEGTTQLLSTPSRPVQFVCYGPGLIRLYCHW